MVCALLLVFCYLQFSLLPYLGYFIEALLTFVTHPLLYYTYIRLTDNNFTLIFDTAGTTITPSSELGGICEKGGICLNYILNGKIFYGNERKRSHTSLCIKYYRVVYGIHLHIPYVYVCDQRVCVILFYNFNIMSFDGCGEIIFSQLFG